MSIAITLLALLVEATLGYPDRVLRTIGHPVMWLGRMIDWLDVILNRDTQQRRSTQGGGVCCSLPDRLHSGRCGLRRRKLPFAFAVTAS